MNKLQIRDLRKWSSNYVEATGRNNNIGWIVVNQELSLCLNFCLDGWSIFHSFSVMNATKYVAWFYKMSWVLRILIFPEYKDAHWLRCTQPCQRFHIIQLINRWWLSVEEKNRGTSKDEEKCRQVNINVNNNVSKICMFSRKFHRDHGWSTISTKLSLHVLVM